MSTLICAQVELDELKDQKVLKKWFKLSEAEGRKGSVAGHVLLHVQWRHDPAIAFEPFSEDTSEKTPNELRIGMLSVSARNLRAVDTHSSVSTQADGRDGRGARDGRDERLFADHRRCQ